ncbi:hypothetical protein [Streptomyces sp. R41]|uniref:Uncharacterized protein n=1 Tax=Streptomyces sp. R41 TaxID=3238632 RepID=A0AB39R6T3_9ACTN
MRAARTAHGKSYGLVKAAVRILHAPRAYAQGIFARPDSFDAVVRYSNGLGHLRADSLLGAACGMGIKVFGVPGRSLPHDEAEATTFDLNLINNRVFFANRLRQWLADFLTREGTLERDEWLWDELFAMMSFTQVPRKNLLSYTYGQRRQEPAASAELLG